MLACKVIETLSHTKFLSFPTPFSEFLNPVATGIDMRQIINAASVSSGNSWPGNIRELQNMVERAVILSTEPALVNPLSKSVGSTGPAIPASGTFRDSERAVIQQALRETGCVVGGPAGAAARLGLKRTTLIAKMKKLGISRPAPRRNAPVLAAPPATRPWWPTESDRDYGAA